ncbi:unnamed protein product, partial [Schistosoma turkestanicum]
NITNEISAGSHYALKSIPPNKAFIEISFEYNGNVYRGKLELHLQMDEYSVIEFDSRKEYESCNLPLGLRRTTNLGQLCLTLYAPYWMINKTGKDLTYKSVDDIETSHPAAYTGALLYSSLSKSFFGKRKIPRNESFHSFGSDEVVDESEHLLSSPNQLLQSYMSISNDHNNNYDDLMNHGAADETITMEHPMPTTSLSNSNRMSGYSKINSPSSQSSSRPGGESTKKWWHRVSDSCHSGCCCRSTSRKCRTRTLRTTGYDRLLKLEHKMQVSASSILMTLDYYYHYCY